MSLESLFTKDELLTGTHHVKIAVRGQEITTTIDGHLADTYTDTSGTLHLGLLGFRSYHDTTMDECAIYDNVVLTSYAHGPEGSVVLSEDFQGAGHAFLGGTIVADGTGGKALAVTSTYEETCVMQDTGLGGIPVFRREFAVGGALKSARLYATAMGVFDVFVNGHRVGNPDATGTVHYDELKPGWTDYRKEVNYLSYDVTQLLCEGNNAVGAQVSNGWWGGAISRGVYGATEPGLLLMLRLEYADGTVAHVLTDDTWHCSTCGPVLMGDIYNGESYDARRDTGWSQAGYDDTAWCRTEPFTGFAGQVTPFLGPTVRVREALCRTPRTATVYSTVQATGTTYGQIAPLRVVSGDAPLQLKAGETVLYDMAQNMVGWVRFTVRGERGTRLRFRFGEMLNDNGDAGRANDGPGGSLYTYNLRTAEATLNYIMSGAEGGESFNPSTSFFGFRYCELTATADVEVLALQGQVVGSDIEEVGSFECSHPDVNQLYSNVLWGQRSNFLSIPTDCPQRDERLGWTGDTQIFSRAACYNADARAFYHKWMGDLRNGQRADGAYPDMAPYCNFWGYGNAAWGDAGVIVPWTVYSMYGDTRILADNYESMSRYMDFLAAQSGGGYTYNGAGTSFGDWLAYEAIDARYVSVCYYAYVAGLMGRIARALSSNETDSYALDAAKYEALAGKIKAEFQQRYINSGYLTLDTQTAYLLALAFDLLPADRRTVHINMLRNKIVANGYKLSTGFVGTGLLNQTLSQVGLHDYAYSLLLQRENPSWLYSVDQGATTIWERWDSYTKESGFNKHPWIMNSFNHYAYGVVSEWLFRYVGGIDTDDAQPGFRHFVLRPTPDRRVKIPSGQATITQAKATHRSPHGLISSEWQATDADGHLIYKVTVPVGTTATLLLPLGGDADGVTEGGLPLDQVEGIDYKGVVDGNAVMELSSGVYEFATVQGTPDAVQAPAAHGMTVSPKPFGSSLHIDVDDSVTSVLVTDSHGKVMHSSTSQCDIDTAAWSRGLYVISVTTPSRHYVEKAMKW